MNSIDQILDIVSHNLRKDVAINAEKQVSKKGITTHPNRQRPKIKITNRSDKNIVNWLVIPISNRDIFKLPGRKKKVPATVPENDATIKRKSTTLCLSGFKTEK